MMVKCASIVAIGEHPTEPRRIFQFAGTIEEVAVALYLWLGPAPKTGAREGIVWRLDRKEFDFEAAPVDRILPEEEWRRIQARHADGLENVQLLDYGRPLSWTPEAFRTLESKAPKDRTQMPLVRGRPRGHDDDDDL